MRRVAACVALLCALFAVPADAAPPHAFLVITGSRSAVVDITMPRDTTGTPGSLGYLCADFTTKGTYAAYLLRPVSGRGPTWGGMLTAKWPFGKHPSCFTDHSDDRPLKAGRYRLYLMTDGATTLRVTLPGYTRNVVARPTRPFRVVAEYFDVPGVALPGEVKREFTMTRRTYALQSLYVASDMPAGVETMQVCAGPRGEECPPDIRNSTWTTTWAPNPANPTAGSYFSRLTSFRRPEFQDPPGPYDAYWRVKGVDVPKARAGFWLLMELDEPAYPLGR